MARAPRTADRPISRRVAVLIKRDKMSETPTVVWAHEIPILELIHGEGTVEPISNEKLNEHFRAKASADLLIHNKSQDPFIPPSDALGVGFAFTGSHESEYQRLASVYGKHPEQNQLLVENIYGRFAEGRFSQMVGEAEPSDMPSAQLRQIIRGHGYVPATDKDSSPEQRAEAGERHKELLTATHERLVELVVELEQAYA